ncbi:butyrophilin subfamily 2 member A1-like isoform X2 [Brienomyrus brachyistius]|uniref:butyrophilin subfamily 2 member A1-like isoform X2 n=1 Tax=Brienomyrus brachyistius TaxID=42636 RepID=UPI0020B3107B|nr:butyrophilin subfamily 2 member A1-like isoform X2 [Brienomyrus brachyistius]
MASYVVAVLLFQQFITVFGSFSVTVPQQPILAPVGSSVTLPCSIAPAGSAEGFEVRWYRPNAFTKPVLLYRDKQVQNNDQDSQYSGRVSLDLGGLKEGLMSLHLINVTVEDTSDYNCYVSSNVNYESGTVLLKVSALGAPPVMSVSPVNGNDWNVSCESKGWHPKPDLWWSDSRASTLQHNHLQYKEDNHGMVSVQSWILVSPAFSGLLSCTISLQGGENREGRIALRDTMLQSVAGPWKPAFIVTILIFLLSIITAVLWFIKFRKRESRTRKTIEEKTEPDGMEPQKETVPLLAPEDMKSVEGDLIPENDLAKMKAAEVDIILDKATAHGGLMIVQDKIVRDAMKDNVVDSAVDSSKFTHHTCVLGKNPINSGQSYWEVQLWGENVPLKESWSVGLALATANRHTDRPLISSENFWVLSLREGRLRVSTDPAVELPVRQKPQILGVFLEYDEGRLSFINVTEKKYILTISTKFSGAVYPLFDPKKGDKAPMKILSKKKY